MFPFRQVLILAACFAGASGLYASSTTVVMDLTCSSGCTGSATATWEILGSTFTTLPINLNSINPGDLVFTYASSDASFQAATFGAGDVFGGSLPSSAEFENFGGNNDEFLVTNSGADFKLSVIQGATIDTGVIDSTTIQNPVPEPGTLSLVIVAMLVCIPLLRRVAATRQAN